MQRLAFWELQLMRCFVIQLKACFICDVVAHKTSASAELALIVNSLQSASQSGFIHVACECSLQNKKNGRIDIDALILHCPDCVLTVQIDVKVKINKQSLAKAFCCATWCIVNSQHLWQEGCSWPIRLKVWILAKHMKQLLSRPNMDLWPMLHTWKQMHIQTDQNRLNGSQGHLGECQFKSIAQNACNWHHLQWAQTPIEQLDQRKATQMLQTDDSQNKTKRTIGRIQSHRDDCANWCQG